MNLAATFIAFAFVAGKLGAQDTAARAIADEIRFSLQPLPEQMRSAATVLRMDPARPPEVLRRGTKDGMVCMHLMKGEDAWDARCYDSSMMRLILRVREFSSMGVKADSFDARIKAEVAAGTLTLPASPVAGYRVLGPLGSYDLATGVATAKLIRWQSLHIPFATASAIGLLDQSTISEGQRTRMPYVMRSGTWWSHVMIEHP